MVHTVRTHLTALPGLHWQRFEDSLQAGIPDINFCYQGREYWIEAKYIEPDNLPKRESTLIRIGLRVEQVLWLDTRKEAGGRVLVLCKIGQEWLLWNDHFRQLWRGMLPYDLRFTTVANWKGAFDVERVLT